MMEYIKPIFIGLMFFSLNCYADEAGFPDFEEPPERYENNHEVGWSWQDPTLETDQLFIGDVSNNGLKFWFWIIGTNGHQCSASGSAKKIDNVYEYKYAEEISDVKQIKSTKLLKARKCTLHIKLNNDEATLEDKGGCYNAFCGARANIGITKFQKVNDS